ncbi:MAG: DNA repair protein RecN [Oscillospiraceae bacterium]|mgnify:CR=1 FL=1|nr:DNA repair protein RecN [Oscillospiraceae bacterium]
MLRELHIENIAVIEKADIDFREGMTVLTGETGAGKSIIVDSLGAVLGARTSRELVRSGAEKGIVSAVFECRAADNWLRENDIEPEDEIVIQRRISPDGKSSCRICGVPVSVSQLRELGALLLDIHGQNDGRQLMDESRHREYLDSFGDNSEVLSAYKACYREYVTCRREINRLSMDEIEKARLAESMQYQIAELEKAELRAGEEEELTAKRDLLRNSEKLTEALDSAYSALYNSDDCAVAMADEAANMMSRAANFSDELRETVSIIENASSMLYDASERIRDFRSSLEFSPEEYDNIESRISLLRRLRRKYNMDEVQMLEHLENCRSKLMELEYSDDMLAKLNRQLEALTEKCRGAAEKLTKSRIAAAARLEKRITEELRDLSMPSVVFKTAVLKLDSELGFDANGADEIRFLISANAGMELGRISKIASGGELSRIMLAMKTVFSANDTVETMVFDEIDTGVSGIAAQRVGEKLSNLSCGKQVLCITHLPQIAAIADNHDLILKTERSGRTYTEVTELDRQGRRRELARLHGGDNITELTLASAEEQIAAAENYKKQNRK